MPTLSSISWKRAAGLSCLAVYGPFLVMALYMFVFVSCPHCKTTAWALLPWAPALLPLETGRQWFGLARPPEGMSLALGYIISASMVLLLTCLVRRGRWLRFTGLAVALALFSICALLTYATIRA